MKKLFSKLGIGTFIVVLFASSALHAQDATRKKVPAGPFPNSNTFTAGTGINQALLGGFNIQIDYTSKRMVFDWSQGFNINLSGNTASKQARDQMLAERMTTTLGFGIGYRVSAYFDIRFEPKMHFWNVYYEGASKDAANKLFSYTTATIGIGAYYKYYPFKKAASGVSGIVIMPSLRYWPNVYSSLEDNKKVYFNKVTGKKETYKSEIQGFPGTGGLLANVTVGYTFGKKKGNN